MSGKNKQQQRRAASRWAALSASLTLHNATGLVTRLTRWYLSHQKGRSAGRLMQVEETVSLGQKRFAAVIRVENVRYLVGGGANDVVLLAALGQQAVRGDGTGDRTGDLEQPDQQPLHAVPAPEPSFREVLAQAAAVKTPEAAKSPAAKRKGEGKRCA